MTDVRYMCPWRSWIARWTPTPKVAGSNPVGHTMKPCQFRAGSRKAYGSKGLRLFLCPKIYPQKKEPKQGFDHSDRIRTPVSACLQRQTSVAPFLKSVRQHFFQRNVGRLFIGLSQSDRLAPFLRQKGRQAHTARSQNEPRCTEMVTNQKGRYDKGESSGKLNMRV